jgi:hypothetical protein
MNVMFSPGFVPNKDCCVAQIHAICDERIK